MSAFYRVLAWASGIGFVAAAAWHVLVLLGSDVPKPQWMPLFLGIFVVWVPAVLSIMPLRDRIASDRWHMWSIVLEGAPTWMFLGVIYIGIYGVVNFLLATGGLGRITDRDPAFPRAGSGSAMVFYFTAMAILQGAKAREGATRCPEGHLIAVGQSLCTECGRKADEGPNGQHGA